MQRMHTQSIAGLAGVTAALLALLGCSQPDFVPKGTTDRQTASADDAQYVEGQIDQVDPHKITIQDLDGQQREIAIAEDADDRTWASKPTLAKSTRWP